MRTTKSIVVLLLVIAFTVGTIGLANAGSKGDAELRGTVTKIDGNKITVKDAAGKETTVEVKKLPEGLKVGDRVTVKDREVVRERPRRVIEGC